MFKTKELKPVATELNSLLQLDDDEKIKTIAVKPGILEQSIRDICEKYEEEIFELEFSLGVENMLERMGILEFESDITDDSSEDDESEEENEDDESEEENEEENEEETEDDESEEENEEENEEETEEEPKTRVPKLTKAIKKTAIDVAADLVKVLKITDDGKNPMPRMKKLSFEELYEEISDMVYFIGQSYEVNGQVIEPKEKKADFKAVSLKFFDAAGLKPKWPTAEKSTEKKKKATKTRKKKEEEPIVEPEKNEKKPASAAKKKAPTAAKKKKAATKKDDKTLGTPYAVIDDMLLQERTFVEMIEKLVSLKYCDTELTAACLITGYFHTLSQRGVSISYDKKTRYYQRITD